MSEYIPSPREWVAEQVELYEGSGGTEGLTLRDPGLPVIVVTNRGRKTGAIRKTPLMRVVDGNNYILVASQGGAPQHPEWYYNLKADPNIEVRGAGISKLSRVPKENRASHSSFLSRTRQVRPKTSTFQAASCPSMIQK